LDAFFNVWETQLGPMVTARAALEPEGKWEAARAEVRALFEAANVRDDGSFAVEPEYQLTVVRP
jgi:hypothetical protein